MLRILVLLLLLANGAFFLWSQGHLAAWGLAPQEQREPERLQQQIAPDAVRLIQAAAGSGEPAAPERAAESAADSDDTPGDATQPPPETSAAPAVAAPAVTQAPAAAVATGPQTRSCWQASGFTETQAETLRASLALLGLPTGTWQLREFRSPGRWLVYLGRYDNMAQLERKLAELRGLNVEARTVTTPGLTPGLSLGGYPTEAAAQEALQKALRSGVRTARVALERAESIGYTLRLPSALPAERNAVAALGPALAGKTLQACSGSRPG